MIYSKTCTRERKSPTVAFNSTVMNIEDVLSINNCFVHSFIDSIYPIDLQLKYTTESESPGSYVNIFLERGNNGNQPRKPCDKHNDFTVFRQFSFTYVAVYFHHLHMDLLYLG